MGVGVGSIWCQAWADVGAWGRSGPASEWMWGRCRVKLVQIWGRFAADPGPVRADLESLRGRFGARFRE